MVVGSFQSLRICYYERLVHWWMTHMGNYIGILGIYYDDNLVTLGMTENEAFRRLLLVQKFFERMMVSGMTYDIMFQKSQRWVKSQEGVYIALKNNLMTLDTVITQLPGSMPNENQVWYHIQLEQTLCCYKRRRIDNFLTLMCFVVLSRGNLCPARQREQPLLHSFENLSCLVRDCECVGTSSKNRYSFCKLLKACPIISFQTIDVIYFKTVVSFGLSSVSDLPDLK